MKVVNEVGDGVSVSLWLPAWMRRSCGFGDDEIGVECGKESKWWREERREG